MDPRRGATPPVYAASTDSLALPPLSSLALSAAAAKELLHRGPSAHSCQDMLLHHHARDPDHRTPSPLSSASSISLSPIPPSRIPQDAPLPTSALVTPWPKHLPSEQHQRRWDLDRPEASKRLGHSTTPFTLAPAKDESSTGPVDAWARNYSLQTQIALPSTTFGAGSIHHLARPVVFDRGSYPHHDFYPPATDTSGLKSNGGGANSFRSPLDSHGKFEASHSLPREGQERHLDHTLASRDGLPLLRPRSERGAEARYYGDVIEEVEDNHRMNTHQGFTSSHSYLHSYTRTRPQREMLHKLDHPPQQQLQLDATPHRHSGSHTYSTAAPAESYIAHNQRHTPDHGSLDRISLREGSAITLSEHPSASSLQYHSPHPHSQNIQHQTHQQQPHQQNSPLSLRDPAQPSLPPVSSLSAWEPPLKEHPSSSSGKIAKKSSATDLTSVERCGQQQPQTRIERLSGEQKENQGSTLAFDTDAQRPSAQTLRLSSHAAQPFTIPAFNPGQHPSAQPYRSSLPEQTSQHLAYSSPTPSCPAHSPKYVPPSPDYRPVSPPPSFKQSDSDGPQHQRDMKSWVNQTNETQHPSQDPSQHFSQQKSSSDHGQSYGHDSDDQEGPSKKSRMRSKDLRFKFGTDMPKTIDMKAAIESCDMLCKFALHYANQETRDSRLDPSMALLEEARDRATLQTIRTLNSTILIGSQNNGRNEDTEKRRCSSLRQSMDYESRPMRTKEANMDGGEDQGLDSDNDDDDNGEDDEEEADDEDDDYTQFGHGPPPHEMVHELAKAATSIFQLAIRIKAWVGMTPEERVLDEDINMIRGKRCLFMDGSSMMRMSTLDPHSQQGKEWAMIQARASSQGMFKTPGVPEHHPQGFKRQNEGDVEMRSTDRWDYSSQSTPVGSFASNAPSFSPMDSSAGDMMFDRPKLTSGSSNKALGSVENNGMDGEAPPQKYRKRAKRTQPPGRCLSCDSSDTPEWRRGPDGARTLCNACGLHYAKLVKRQNQQQAKQLQEQQAKQRALQNGDQKVDKMVCDLDGMDSEAKKPTGIQLQTIKFQFPRRPARTLPADDATRDLMDQDRVEPS